MKPKPSSGTGMLSAAGLSGGVSGSAKPKVLGIAPPPGETGKIRSPLPPPPNDPAAARMNSATRSVGLRATEEATRHSTTDAFSDLSQIEVSHLFEIHHSYYFGTLDIFNHGEGDFRVFT